MKKVYILLFMSFTLISSWTDCFAQRQPQSAQDDPEKEDSPASVTVRGGATVLFADLNEQSRDWGYGLDIKVPITRALAGMLLFDKGAVKAQESSYYSSKANGNFTQIAVGGSVDLLQLFRLGGGGTNTIIDLYSGIGMIFFQTKAYNLVTGELQRFTSDFTSHHSPDGIKITSPPGIRYTREMVIPIGLSLSKAISQQFSVQGGFRLNLVRTDKLDATVDNDNSIRVNHNGGNIYGNQYKNNTDDKWLLISAGLTYFFR